MKANATLSQRLARRFIAHASNLLQQRRAAWARAMRSEFEYVPQGFSALRWSLGCLFASYTERVVMMEIGNLKATRISRVVLTLEMLLCFLIPTQALLAAFVAIALPPFTPFWSTPLSALLLTTSLIGPVGLFLAFKSIVLEQRQMSKGLAVGFCGLAGWTFVGNAFFVLSIASPGYELRGVFLMALLPLVGAVHLVYLANTEKGELAHA